MHDPSGDLRRLEDALDSEWRLTGLACDLRVLQQLQPALRDGDWKVTVAVHGGEPDHRRLAGLPRARLRHRRRRRLDDDRRASVRPGQRRGRRRGRRDESADPLRRGSDEPRVVRDDESRRRDGDDRRRCAPRSTTSPPTSRARPASRARTSSRRPSSAIRSCTTCCSASIRSSSAARRSRSRPTPRSTLWATEIDLAVHRNARIYVLPCIAGHVGADAAGVVLAERPDLSDEMTLLVDVGTNAEIVLGNRQRLLACSSPTGPAFEGAQISCGQRAAPGAIERVRIDPATLEPRFKVIGCELWSDEPGFAEATAATGVTGICGSGIIEAIAEMYLAGVIRHDGVVDGALAARNAAHPRGRPHLLLPPPSRRGRPRAVAHHAERRARHPARQGRALRRRAPADGAPGRSSASTASASPAPSAATSTSSTRWCSA